MPHLKDVSSEDGKLHTSTSQNSRVNFANFTRQLLKLNASIQSIRDRPIVLSTAKQPDSKQTNRAAKGIDKEVVAETKLLYQQAAYGHRQKQGGRDKRYLKHVDGVAVTCSRDGTNGKTANANAQAEQKLGGHRAEAQFPKRLRRPEGHT